MKKGSLGPGTLIIFLALILVAAIAAGVMIQTTGLYQQNVLETGDETREEISSIIVTIEIFVEDGSDSRIDYFYHAAKLSPGSEPTKFDNTLITLTLYNVSESYAYNTSIDCKNTTTMTPSSGYGVTFLFEGDNYMVNRLNDGDVIEFCYQSPRSISEAENVQLTIIPTIGTKTEIKAAIPDVVALKRTVIYPKGDSFL